MEIYVLLFLNMKSKNAGKLARKTREIPFYRAAYFSFWKIYRVGWRD